MKSVLLIGLGRFGRNAAEKMYELRYEVMAVDRNEEKVNEILPLVTDAQIGDATSEIFLKSLGVDNYDVCFVTISDDFLSALQTTSLLKELGAKKVIARANSDVQKKFLLRNGADDVVYPEEQMADWMVVRYAVDYVLDYIALDDEYAIYDVAVPADWDGKTVGALDIRRKYDLNLLAVRSSASQRTAVTSDTILRENQTILVLGKWKDVQKCFRI